MHHWQRQLPHHQVTRQTTCDTCIKDVPWIGDIQSDVVGFLEGNIGRFFECVQWISSEKIMRGCMCGHPAGGIVRLQWCNGISYP